MNEDREEIIMQLLRQCRMRKALQIRFVILVVAVCLIGWYLVELHSSRSRIKSEFALHDGPIIQIALSGSGKYLASCGIDRNVVVFDLINKKMKQSWLSSKVFHKIVFSRDDKMVATLAGVNEIEVRDAATGVILFEQSVHGASISDIAFLSNNEFVFSEGPTLVYFDSVLWKQKKRRTPESPESRAILQVSVDFSTDWIITHDATSVTIWKQESQLVLDKSTLHQACDISHASYFPGISKVVFVADAVYSISPVKNGKTLAAVSISRPMVPSVSSAPGSSLLAVLIKTPPSAFSAFLYGGCVEIVNVNTLDIIDRIHLMHCGCNCISVNSDGSIIYCGTINGIVEEIPGLIR